METPFNIWLLLSGIGLLLFGMHTFEHAIKYLWGSNLKGILQKYTNWPWSSIFTGTWSTALLQSSSLVSLLVLAFTGAGVMALSNGIGVIIWANIGTTVSALLVAWLWFGEFKIAAFAMPIIAFWGLMLIYNGGMTWKNWAKLFIGFWLLFLWLDFMKESVEAIKASFDLAAYKDLNLWLFGLLWVVVTAVIQSSSAVWVMTLIALSEGLIGFPASIAIVMWSNIGTTFTGVIASLGGKTIKRQIALSQVLFNVLSSIVWVVFFYGYIWLTLDVLWFRDNEVMGNAVLNAIFNVSTAVLFGFFLKPFTKLVRKIVPDDSIEDKTIQLKIDAINFIWWDDTLSQAAVYALQQDTQVLVENTLDYLTYALNIDQDYLETKEFDQTSLMKHMIEWDKVTHQEQYEHARTIANRLYEMVLKLRENSLPTHEASLLQNSELAIEACLRAIKSIKNIYHDLQDLAWSTTPAVQSLYTQSRYKVALIAKHLADIIDMDYTSEDFEEVRAAMNELDSFHTGFEEYLTQIVAEGKETDIPLSVLMNIDHYLYQGSEKLVEAVRKVYL